MQIHQKLANNASLHHKPPLLRALSPKEAVGSKTTRQIRCADSLVRLQQRYGNNFVQRIVNLSRREENGSGTSPEVKWGVRVTPGHVGLRRGAQVHSPNHGLRAGVVPN